MQTAQSFLSFFLIFGHIISLKHAIILTVKTPNTLYIVFTNPIVKQIPSPKKAADRRLSFFISNLDKNLFIKNSSFCTNISYKRGIFFLFIMFHLISKRDYISRLHPKYPKEYRHLPETVYAPPFPLISPMPLHP